MLLRHSGRHPLLRVSETERGAAIEAAPHFNYEGVAFWVVAVGGGVFGLTRARSTGFRTVRMGWGALSARLQRSSTLALGFARITRTPPG
jgi:hypothetical protein